MKAYPGGRAERRRRVEVLPVHLGEPRPGRADEERRGHEGLGDDHAEGRERQGDPDGAQRAAGQAVPPERGEQGDAGHRRRQHHRQVDERLEHALAGELAGGEDVRHRQAERHDDGGRGDAGEQAQPKRLQDERVLEPRHETARRYAEHEAHQRQAEEGDQQPAEERAAGAPQHARERAPRRERCGVAQGWVAAGSAAAAGSRPCCWRTRWPASLRTSSTNARARSGLLAALSTAIG